MILLKNDEIIDFWTWPPTDFSALKMFKLKMLFNFQKKRLPRYCQWRHSDALTNSNLFCLYIITKLLFFSSNRRLPTGFIFQQGSAPAHTASSAGNWLWTNCPDFIIKDLWPLNSPNANTVDYHMWCAMLELTASLKQSQKQSWNSRNRFRLSGATYHNDQSTRLWKTVKLSDWRFVLERGAIGGHFEHSQWQWNFGIWSLVNCVVWLVLTMLLN